MSNSDCELSLAQRQALKAILFKHFSTTKLAKIDAGTGIATLSHILRDGSPRAFTNKMAFRVASILGIESPKELFQLINLRSLSDTVSSPNAPNIPRILFPEVAKLLSRSGYFIEAEAMFLNIAAQLTALKGSDYEIAEFYRKASNQARNRGNLEEAQKFITHAQLIVSRNIPQNASDREIIHRIEVEAATLNWRLNGRTKEFHSRVTSLDNSILIRSTKVPEALKIIGSYRTALARYREDLNSAKEVYDFERLVLNEIGLIECKMLLYGNLETDDVKRLESICDMSKSRWTHAFLLAAKVLVDKFSIGTKTELAKAKFLASDMVKMAYVGSRQHIIASISQGRLLLAERNFADAECIFNELVVNEQKKRYHSLPLESAVAELGYIETIRHCTQKYSTNKIGLKYCAVYEKLANIFSSCACKWGLVRCQYAIRIHKPSYTVSFDSALEGIDMRFDVPPLDPCMQLFDSVIL